MSQAGKNGLETVIPGGTGPQSELNHQPYANAMHGDPSVADAAEYALIAPRCNPKAAGTISPFLGGHCVGI